MLAKTTGYVLTGLEGNAVDVEVDTNLGLPAFEIVGLPDAAVKESKERVRSAVKNSGKKFPVHKITVNLAPAELKKEGAGLDLPIAVGIIAADGQLGDMKNSPVMVGELSLDGGIRGINGILPTLISARENGVKSVIIPKENEQEGGYIDGIDVFVASTLKEVCDFIEGKSELKKVELKNYENEAKSGEYDNDLKYVRGQFVARRALDPSGILQEARRQHIPVILLAGAIEDAGILNAAGFRGVFSITPSPVSLEQAMQPEFAQENIRRTVEQICRIFF